MTNEESRSPGVPIYKKKWFIAASVLLVLSAIGSVTGGSDGSSNSPSEVESSNPLATSDNKSACSALRFVYAKNSGVISDWANQAATDADAAKAMQTIGKNFSDIGMTASGDLQTVMVNVGTSYKRMYVALMNGDSNLLGTEISKSLEYATTFDTLCKSIGEN